MKHNQTWKWSLVALVSVSGWVLACDKAELIKDAKVVLLGQVVGRDQQGVNPYQLQVTYHVKPLRVAKGEKRDQYDVVTAEVPPIYMADPKTGKTKTVDVNDSLGSSPWRPKPGDGQIYLLVLDQETGGLLHLAKNHPDSVKKVSRLDDLMVRHMMGLAMKEGGQADPPLGPTIQQGTLCRVEHLFIGVCQDQGKGYQSVAGSTLVRGTVGPSGLNIVCAPGGMKDETVGQWDIPIPEGLKTFGGVALAMGPVEGMGFLTVDVVDASGAVVYCGRPMLMTKKASLGTIQLGPKGFWKPQADDVSALSGFEVKKCHRLKFDVRGEVKFTMKEIRILSASPVKKS